MSDSATNKETARRTLTLFFSDQDAVSLKKFSACCPYRKTESNKRALVPQQGMGPPSVWPRSNGQGDGRWPYEDSVATPYASR